MYHGNSKDCARGRVNFALQHRDFSKCEQAERRSAGTHWQAGREPRWPPPTTGNLVWWKAAPSGLGGRSADQQSGPRSPSGCTPASCQTALEGPEAELCHFAALWSKCISQTCTSWVSPWIFAIVGLCVWMVFCHIFVQRQWAALPSVPSQTGQ